jgi:hypothetical protein
MSRIERSRAAPRDFRMEENERAERRPVRIYGRATAMVAKTIQTSGSVGNEVGNPDWSV